MIISQFPANGGSGGALPQFTYDGESSIVLDSGGWKVKFLTSGTLTMKSGATVDVFLVGGGGRGLGSYTGRMDDQQGGQYYSTTFGGGGGGGYTFTQKEVSLAAGHEYRIIVGSSGNYSSFVAQDEMEAETINYFANPGQNASSTAGGDGGSGGSSGGDYMTYLNGSYYAGTTKVNGGTDGGDGQDFRWRRNGSGQGTTTREFGGPSGELYASGGSSYYRASEIPTIVPNTGNGGTGGNNGAGASGIVIIRNAR